MPNQNVTDIIDGALADSRRRAYTNTEIGRVSVPTEEIFSFAGAAGLVTGIIVYPYSYAAVVNGVPAADHYSNLNALPPRTLRLVTRIQDAERERRRAGTDPVDEVPIGRTETGEPVYPHVPLTGRGAPYLAVAVETPEALDGLAEEIIRRIQMAFNSVETDRDRPIRLALIGEDATRLTGWGEIARDQIVETLRGVRHG